MNYLLAIAAAGLAIFAVCRVQRGGGEGGSAGGWMPTFEPQPDAVNIEDGAYMTTADPMADTVAAQLPTMAEAAVVNVRAAVSALPDLLGLASPVAYDVARANEVAGLAMLAYAEGTGGPNGYRTLFGGGLFDDMSAHPKQFFSFKNSRGETLRTSAAGRYQFLWRTWEALRVKLDLPDFGPASQDAGALELIRQRGALADLQAGRVQAFVQKCAPVWASLPGAGYAQPERKFHTLVASFQAAGGNLES